MAEADCCADALRCHSTHVTPSEVAEQRCVDSVHRNDRASGMLEVANVRLAAEMLPGHQCEAASQEATESHSCNVVARVCTRIDPIHTGHLGSMLTFGILKSADPTGVTML